MDYNRKSPSRSRMLTSGHPCSHHLSSSSYVSHFFVLCLGALLHIAHGLSLDIKANTRVSLDAMLDVRQFAGDDRAGKNHFRVVHLNGSSMLLGARNVVYNISLDTLKENKRIKWESSEGDIKLCGFKQKSNEECQNYIRVIAPTPEGDFLVCGTNAFKPSCRRYRNQGDDSYELIANESGVAKCPYDPSHNNSALFAGDLFFSATVADMTARDALIYSDSLRTVQHNSQWLNEPDFVSSFEHQDKVYFFFRETAVEYINCGKARFSRVARVCKNDRGGARVLQSTFTSFFKARLNCSIPGEYPFYFDEIESTSEIGQGNVIPSVIQSDRETMIYAVFNTPQNSIKGSAVCAFRFSDVLESFEGPFKEQKTPSSNWLPVKESEQPSPHPAKSCSNDSTSISDSHLNFIKTHPLMDKAVPSFGSAPVLMQASFSHRMTTIAVDWQFRAVDDRYYDILFVGTDHGHVLKAINKGTSSSMDPVIIEDLEVFPDGSPVLQVKVFRDVGAREERLIVVSANEIKSLPLQRCHLYTTCTACVAAQDPYCAWAAGICAQTNQRDSIQSLVTGLHPSCPPDETKDQPQGTVQTLPETEPSSTTTSCAGDCGKSPTSAPATEPQTSDSTPAQETEFPVKSEKPRTTTDMDNNIPVAIPDPCVGASVAKSPSGQYAPSDMAVAIIFCIMISLALGFAGGYFFSLRRHGPRPPTSDPFQHRNPEKVENTYDVGPIAHRRNDLTPPAKNSTEIREKQLNVEYNPLKPNSGRTPNGSIETTVSPGKSKKVYV